MTEAETFDVVKIEKGVRKNIIDTVAKEAPLTIFLNGHKHVTLFCTPDKPKYLAAGCSVESLNLHGFPVVLKVGIYCSKYVRLQLCREIKKSGLKTRSFISY
jgi:hypothetical protein